MSQQAEMSGSQQGKITTMTARKRIGQAQRDHDLFKLFIEHAPAALAMFDREMRYLAASRRWIEQFLLAGVAFLDRSHFEVVSGTPDRWKDALRCGLAGEETRGADNWPVPLGDVRSIRWAALPWRQPDGIVGGIVVCADDVTQEKAKEERLHLAASVFTHATEGIMITAPDGGILDVNDAFTRITGYSREEVIGRNPRILNSGRQNREFYADMWTQLLEEGHWSGEIWNRAKNGQIYAEMLTISAVPDAAGNARQYIALFSDITSIKEQEAKLERVAHYDLLTGLPNRVLLADRLRQAMAQAHRNRRHVAVACLDLDNFRDINDRHGHIVGDRLLTAIAHRMKQELREGDTVARLGGDELVVVLLELSGLDEAISLMDNLLRAAAEPVALGEFSFCVSASIGVTLFPQAEDVDPDQLLRQADQAMYHAKISGKSRYHVFDPALDRSLRSHHEDQERIRLALNAREFVLYFQPKVNMRTGAILGAEALVRWRHPEQGILSPAQFLPVVAGNPLMIELGRWVIEAALTQLESWRANGFDIPVSVNLEALQLQEPGFSDWLSTLLGAHPGVPPSRLEMEVLESSALLDVAEVSKIIRACSRLGVSFALDDFGTGYSSLSYLKQLPVHALKIDQSFVHDMLDDPEDLAILEGVLALATAFRREAVAEGVETVEHGLMLLRLGCRHAQGNGIARAMPGPDLPAWAAHWRPDPRWATTSPVDTANFPLLYAGVEHRAWIQDIEDLLHGRRHHVAAMDYHLCRFGAWMDAEISAGRGSRPGYQALDVLHQRLHDCANEVLARANREGHSAAQSGLRQLSSLRNHLLEKLHLLMQSL